VAKAKDKPKVIKQKLPYSTREERIKYLRYLNMDGLKTWLKLGEEQKIGLKAK